VKIIFYSVQKSGSSTEFIGLVFNCRLFQVKTARCYKFTGRL